jgi:hypothetical protein
LAPDNGFTAGHSSVAQAYTSELPNLVQNGDWQAVPGNWAFHTEENRVKQLAEDTQHPQVLFLQDFDSDALLVVK